MIDFHSHIIPDIDDGSRNMAETIQLLKEAKNVGFDGVVLTSHYIEDYYEKTEKERQKLINEIRDNLEKNSIDINIYIGNENYISNNLTKLLDEKKASTINKTKYVLFEMPLTLEKQPMNLKDFIYTLQGKKYVPVLAHPERYRFVHRNPEVIYNLVNMGVLMQSNYGSILGQYGKKSEIVTKILLKNNLVHFLGSDVHRTNTVYNAIPNALNKIEKIVGKEKLKELTTINPERAVNNKNIKFELSDEFKISFMDKIALNSK